MLMAMAARFSCVAVAARLSPDSAGDTNTIASIIASQQVRRAPAFDRFIQNGPLTRTRRLKKADCEVDFFFMNEVWDEVVVSLEAPQAPQESSVFLKCAEACQYFFLKFSLDASWTVGMRESRVQRAKSRAQSAERREQRAESREQSAESEEQRRLCPWLLALSP
jgi:predicted deacylase